MSFLQYIILFLLIIKVSNTAMAYRIKVVILVDLLFLAAMSVLERVVGALVRPLLYHCTPSAVGLLFKI